MVDKLLTLVGVDRADQLTDAQLKVRELSLAVAPAVSWSIQPVSRGLYKWHFER